MEVPKNNWKNWNWKILFLVSVSVSVSQLFFKRVLFLCIYYYIIYN